MCGIFGEYRFDGRPVNAVRLRSQINLLSHRGPDASALWMEGTVGLGHTRLSIIDLSSCGNQPMTAADGSAVIVYNGEVYNFGDLKRALDGKYRFVGRSDTEVVLAALTQDGLDAARKFEGMFAIGYYDRQNRRLHLIRDGFGIKPLYYHVNENRIVFSSEIKPLLLDPETPREADLDALRSHLLFGYSPDPKTAFRGIYRVPPGHILTVGPSGVESERAFWQVEELLQQPVGDLLETLRESVRLHLISDVPTGLFLSAGIDSSLLLASSERTSAHSIRTFNVGLEEDDPMPGRQSRIERRLARQTSELFGAAFQPLHPVEKTPSLAEMMSSIEEPIFNPSNALIDLVTSAARSIGTKVLLSGHGGDEMFAGYRRHVFARHLRKLSLPLLRHGLRTAAKFNRSSVVARMAQSVGRDSAIDPLVNLTAIGVDLVTAHSVAPGFLQTSQLASVATPQADLLAKWRHLSPLKQLMLLDIKTYLAAQNLINMDKASMRRSVEVRVPYLYRPLAAIGLQSTDAELIQTVSNKASLRRAARKVLPSYLFSAPKMGFGPPPAALVGTEEAEELLIGPGPRGRGLFDTRVVERLLRMARQNGDAQLAIQLHGLAVIEQWLQTFIDDVPAAVAREQAATRKRT